MKGIYKFIVSNRRVNYNFEIRRNITVIKGQSATGKTQLIRMLRQYQILGRSSGVKVNTNARYYAYDRMDGDWNRVLFRLQNTIIFIDEDNDFINSNAFSSYLQTTGNYAVLITRRSIGKLPYSIKEIYEITSSFGTRVVCNQLSNVYSNFPNITKNISNVIIEDSNTGFEVFSKIFSSCNTVSSYGNGNVLEKLEDLPDELQAYVEDEG